MLCPRLLVWFASMQTVMKTKISLEKKLKRWQVVFPRDMPRLSAEMSSLRTFESTFRQHLVNTVSLPLTVWKKDRWSFRFQKRDLLWSTKNLHSIVWPAGTDKWKRKRRTKAKIEKRMVEKDWNDRLSIGREPWSHTFMNLFAISS